MMASHGRLKNHVLSFATETTDRMLSNNVTPPCMCISPNSSERAPQQADKPATCQREPVHGIRA